MFCPTYVVATIYLHLRVSVDFQFNLLSSPTKFGFLAYGVYRVPLFCFQKTTSLWHFQVLYPSFHLRYKTAVTCVPKFMVSFSISTTIISDRASMDFPLNHSSDCLQCTTCYISHFQVLLSV